MRGERPAAGREQAVTSMDDDGSHWQIEFLVKIPHAGAALLQ